MRVGGWGGGGWVGYGSVAAGGAAAVTLMPKPAAPEPFIPCIIREKTGASNTYKKRDACFLRHARIGAQDAGNTLLPVKVVVVVAVHIRILCVTVPIGSWRRNAVRASHQSRAFFFFLHPPPPLGVEEEKLALGIDPDEVLEFLGT